MAEVFLNALGIISALGRGKAATLDALLHADRSGVDQNRVTLGVGSEITFGGVKGELADVPSALAQFQSRNIALLFSAFEEIEAETKDAIQKYGADRIAVVIGTSTSGIEEGEKAISGIVDGSGPPEIYDFLQQEMAAVSEVVARHLNLSGPALTISTACSSSGKVFSSARRLIAQGLVDAVIVGGVDSYCQLIVNGFFSLSALHNGNGCLPFSKNRTGTVLGEGAALFLMSREARGCRLGGVGESSDAYNMTAPDPTGRGAARAMQEALDDAGLKPGDIQYLNLHGTGTRQNDAMEAKAVRSVFGQTEPPLGSTKPLSGHTLGAAGAIEAGFCWLLLSSNHRPRGLPPHASDNMIDEEIEVRNFVKANEHFRESGFTWCMSNSYAFGGSNVSVILGKAAEQ